MCFLRGEGWRETEKRHLREPRSFSCRLKAATATARFERGSSVEKWHLNTVPSYFDIRIVERYIYNCQPMVPGTNPRQQEPPIWGGGG